jgi:DNA end-binding protein Ku
MPSPSLWSGNLRLSLVLIPVRLIPAVSAEEAISFRQIHEPSGTPIRYVKGVHDGDTFTEVPDEEIIKDYEYAKGQHVLPPHLERVKPAQPRKVAGYSLIGPDARNGVCTENLNPDVVVMKSAKDCV